MDKVVKFSNDPRIMYRVCIYFHCMIIKYIIHIKQFVCAYV